jgi:hypothetical protein
MSEPTTLEDVLKEVQSIKTDNDKFSQKLDSYNELLETYQKSSDIVVRLSFTLIVSATVALAISAITLIVKFLTS